MRDLSYNFPFSRVVLMMRWMLDHNSHAMDHNSRAMDHNSHAMHHNSLLLVWVVMRSLKTLLLILLRLFSKLWFKTLPKWFIRWWKMSLLLLLMTTLPTILKGVRVQLVVVHVRHLVVDVTNRKSDSKNMLWM
jgi:hypothetical protein